MIAEDRDYIERVLAGETGAFDGLVRKYNRMAGAIAYAIVGDFSSAEDVVQEAFLKAYRRLADLREPGKFRVWLAGIVRSAGIDWVRRRKSQRLLPFSQVFTASSPGVLSPRSPGGDGGPSDGPQMSSPPEGAEPGGGSRSLVDASPSVEEIYSREELRQKVLEAVDRLPEEDRLVVTLKHMEGLSYREIAEITGATVSAVESRLFRARQALRRRLDHILK